MIFKRTMQVNLVFLGLALECVLHGQSFDSSPLDAVAKADPVLRHGVQFLRTAVALRESGLAKAEACDLCTGWQEIEPEIQAPGVHSVPFRFPSS
jgi:hypothetical protein